MPSTRAQRQQETRRRLMDAAEQMFVGTGFDSASLDRIAAEAGFTRGAFYVNFADKSDLLMLVAERAYEVHITRIEQLDPSQPVRDWFSAFPRRGPWFILAMEAWRHAQRNKVSKQRLALCAARLQDALERFLERAAEAHGIALPKPSQELAAALIALRTGLLIQRGIDSTAVPPGTFARAAARLLGLDY